MRHHNGHLVSCVSVMKEGLQNDMETLMTAEERWGGEEVTFELTICLR